MITACRLVLCACLVAGLLAQARIVVQAQINPNVLMRAASGEYTKLPPAPRINPADFTSLIVPAFRYDILQPPFAFTNDTAALLQNAIARRLGIRYRFYGVDDRGYDCSGFVWRVFSEAGADFERVAARTLWRQLPEATAEETRQFGTLVFFNRLKHIGIVRDADSFYHASRSQGIKLSYFTGYWGRRITGFRRAPAPVLPPPPDSIKAIE
jgi:hypothetical protein